MMKAMKELILGRAKDIIVKEELADKLTSEKLRIKFGIDPTGPELHLGRASTIHRLKNLQDMGHQIVLIVGDFTAKIGDASDKTSERQPLTDEQIKKNMTDYKKQIGKILDIDKAEFHYNSQWLSKLDLSKIIELSQQFTVAQMIERENYAQRFKEGKPIGLHEFLYPILQGYDSVEVNADVEIGGTDQLFNLMAGRVMQKYFGQEPQHDITFDLLTGPDGRKMSTSWGNAIYITDSANDMYGQIMRVHDGLIPFYYKICTDFSLEAIEAVERSLTEGDNPRDTKASLAREIVSIYHGEKAAVDAENAFNNQFRDGNLPSDIEEVEITKKEWDPVDLLVGVKMAESRSEARRLVEQGGVRIGGEKIELGEIKVRSGAILQVGKRRFLKLKVK